VAMLLERPDSESLWEPEAADAPDVVIEESAADTTGKSAGEPGGAMPAEEQFVPQAVLEESPSSVLAEEQPAPHPTKENRCVAESAALDQYAAEEPLTGMDRAWSQSEGASAPNVADSIAPAERMTVLETEPARYPLELETTPAAEEQLNVPAVEAERSQLETAAALDYGTALDETQTPPPVADLGKPLDDPPARTSLEPHAPNGATPGNECETALESQLPAAEPEQHPIALVEPASQLETTPEPAACGLEQPASQCPPLSERVPYRREPLLLAPAPPEPDRLLLAADIRASEPVSDSGPSPQDELGPPFELTAGVPESSAPAVGEVSSELLAPEKSENQLALDLAPAAPGDAAPSADSEPESEPGPNALASALHLQAEVLLDHVAAELAAATAAEQAAIGAVVASFEQRPSKSLLAPPPEIVSAPAPPICERIRIPRPALSPLPPPPANLAALAPRPQPATLAGPCLTAELRNVAKSRTRKASAKSRTFPTWVPSFMGATLLVILAGGSLQYLNNQSDGKPAAPAVSQATHVVAAGGMDALAKSVEISGLRLVKTWNGKQQVRFLIINHSSRDLSGVTLHVGVRASEAAGGAPILTIRAPIRSLGAYQSKEIKSDLDAEVPDSALADWESVRTDVQILRD